VTTALDERCWACTCQHHAAAQTTAETGGPWDNAWRSTKSYLVFGVQLADCSTFVVHWRRSCTDR